MDWDWSKFDALLESNSECSSGDVGAVEATADTVQGFVAASTTAEGVTSRTQVVTAVHYSVAHLLQNRALDYVATIDHFEVHSEKDHRQDGRIEDSHLSTKFAWTFSLPIPQGQ